MAVLSVWLLVRKNTFSGLPICDTCILNIRYFTHSKTAGHHTNPSLSIWNGFRCMAVAYLYLLKGALGLQLFDCWGLMEYKTCARCTSLNLEFSFFVLSLKTNNSPNQTRQTGVRVWAEHFLAARYFSCGRTADCLQIQKMSTPSLVYSASGRVGQFT